MSIVRWARCAETTILTARPSVASRTRPYQMPCAADPSPSNFDHQVTDVQTGLRSRPLFVHLRHDGSAGL
jgi:hypothetical protein